ncbi:MAG: hypothetical protein RL757_2522, partial [Bacteroidota bacterium]
TLFIATILLNFLTIQPILAQNSYAEGWKALDDNDFPKAKIAFQAALKTPSSATDAAMMLQLLSTFDGQEEAGLPYWKAAKIENPYPYYYANWFIGSVLGNYGRKNADQLKLAKALAADPNAPSMLRASAKYQLGHHYLTVRDFKNMNAAWASTGSVNQWQYVGPFDNLSSSGFDKNYAPIEQPQPDAVFKATNNADIKWFQPSGGDNDSWTTPTFNVRWRTAIIYAQSFVTADADKNCTLAIGMTGNIKVWVNDRLLLSEEEIRKTDFDLYQVNCKLKKGVNRVLVQLGIEDEEHANFALRFLEKTDGNMLTGLSYSATYAKYDKDTGGGASEPAKFWAERFFEEKIEKEPKNLLNYVLLSQTYLRSKKHHEALETIEKALAQSPDNLLLRFERVQCYIKNNNRTNLSEEIQYIVDKAPECALSLEYLYSIASNNEKFDEALEILEKREGIFGENEETLRYRINLLGRQEKIQDLLKLIDKGSEKYPESQFFASLRHNVELKLKKDPSAAAAVIEKQLKKQYDVSLALQHAQELIEFGMNDKAIAIYEEVNGLFPYDPSIPSILFNYYLGKKQNKKARVYLNQLLTLAPYNAAYWDNAAKLAAQEGNPAEELSNYLKSLHYDSNDFEVRRRVRELQKKKDLFEVMPKFDPYQIIKTHKTDPKYNDYNYYYVFEDMQTIVYPERNSEMTHHYMIKMLNQKGVDEWKETSIGYNPSRQKLVIDKTEVVKPNGNKVSAERNGNQLVFPNLQVGDVIFIKYHIQSYAYGRMAREFWDKMTFNSFIPNEFARYSLLVPKDMNFESKMENADLKPTVKDVEEFKMYTWQVEKEPAMKEETIAPRFSDIAKILHISTLSDWKTITTWYADMSAQQAKQDYYVKQLHKTLFPSDKKYTETEKARIIYAWIVKNIRYSSVSFRQSGYVPQRASRVIQTRLGDCKDLATLYAALARESGLKANLVLVNTRNNGERDMIMPSMEFNHCIAKVVADGKVWYLELTDNNLPFGALPRADLYATALDIPYGDATVNNQLFILNPENRLKDVRESFISVQVKNRDIQITANNVRQGAPSSSFRESYLNLPKQKAIETIQQSLGSDSKNPVVVKEMTYGDIDNVNDSLHFTVVYNIKGEVAEIGDLKTLKVPYYNDFVKANSFQEETRTLPLNYIEYESLDRYNDQIELVLPDGKQFDAAPKNVDLTFKGIKYTIQFEKIAANKMKVTRRIDIEKRENVSPQEYPKFKEFMDEVVNAEGKYISFK